MIRNIVIALIGLVLCAAPAVAANATPAKCNMMMHEMHGKTAPGQVVCPVSGEPVNKATAATYTYKGKTYYFCCPACISEFKKDPEKYIKRMKEREKQEVK